MNTNILLTASPLSAAICTQFVETPVAGAVVLFTGMVRNHTKGRNVLRLEFEAYTLMALSEMQKIANLALQSFEVCRIAMHHRTGILLPGELPVVIAVSAPHRSAAFEACSYCIDMLKQTVPVWKKEVLEDGEVWVSAHP